MAGFQYLEKEFPEFEVCGIDEAGRGPLAGPVSVGLVVFSGITLEKIHRGEILCSLNDSKKLTSRQRDALYLEILQHSQLAISQFVSNKFIDSHGINPAIFYAIERLLGKSRLKNPFLLIDGNYRLKNPQLQYQSIVKGDQKIASIAAASILAKVSRDRFMENIAKKISGYDFDKHKGYGTKLHLQLIKKNGYSRIHRQSYKIKQ